MTLKYSLDENDFLQHLLFTATKSERIKRKRRRNWVITTFTVFCFGLIFYLSTDIHMLYYCLVSGFITLFFYPIYESYKYKKHYEKFVAETYKGRLHEISTVFINENTIETFDRTGESKINLSELEKIDETRDYFYLKFKIGETLIIPKIKIEGLEKLLDKLQKIAAGLNIHFVADLTWKWK